MLVNVGLRRSQNSLSARVAAILRKYGTDAHVYLPGIGVINGLTAGNYLDSAGTTPATVDNPVGLVLDAGGSVGSELVTNGTNPVNTTGWAALFGLSALTATGGEFLATTTASGQAAGYNITTVIGKTYRVTATVRCGTVGTVDVILNGGVSSAITDSKTNVDISLVFVATATTSAIAVRGLNAVGTYYFNNVSVKEVTGIHATQATTADKMILRSTGGRYWWDAVDGTDKLTATYPAGYESSTTIDAAPTGQVTLTAQNIVGTYTISTDTYGRFVFKTLTADELAIVQTYCNRLAGL